MVLDLEPKGSGTSFDVYSMHSMESSAFARRLSDRPNMDAFVDIYHISQGELLLYLKH